MVEGRTIFNCNRIELVIVASLVLSACGGGGGSPQPPPPPANTLLSLSGSVVDGQGSAISGAQVLLGLTETRTDASGTFSFKNLQAGNYLVSIQDSQGNFDSRILGLSAANNSFAFSIPSLNGGFRVTKVYPPLNNKNAALLGQIVIETTAEPDLATLTESTLLITPDIGDFKISYEAPELVIQPRLQQPPNQTVVVELTSGVRDIAGNPLGHHVRWRFKTSASDNSPPVLIAQSPRSGTTGHPPNLGLSFEFNEPIMNPGNSIVATSNGGINLGVRVLSRTVVLDPDNGWEPMTPYIVTLSGIQDLVGNVVSGTYRLSFTTGERPTFSDNIQPYWHASLDEILFASNRNGSFDIFSIRPDGTGLVQLTNLPGDELHPSLSYSGTTLAFQHRGSENRWDIYTQVSGSPDPLAITPFDSNDYGPQFSRTLSEDIFFVSDRVSPPGIFSMLIDGENPLELDLEFNSNSNQPIPHPLLDTQLLFVSTRGGSQDIWRKSISAIDGSTINLNLTGDSLAHEHSPAWLPDAGSIIYISDEGGLNQLWITDSAGTFPRQVTQFDQPASDPYASPYPGDQLAVVVLSKPSGGTDLVLVDLVGGEITANLTALGDPD